MADTRYCIEYAKSGRSGCKKCQQTIENNSCRVGKVTANPYHDGREMKQWYHLPCFFETFTRARATTKVVESPADLDGFTDLKDYDKEEVKKLIKEFLDKRASELQGKSKGKGASSSSMKPAAAPPPSSSGAVSSPLSKTKKEGVEYTSVSPGTATGGSSGGVSFADLENDGEVSTDGEPTVPQDGWLHAYADSNGTGQVPTPMDVSTTSVTAQTKNQVGVTAEDVLDQFRDQFIKEMDADAVTLDLLNEGIINGGDERSITKIDDPVQQNRRLHHILKQKCTVDAFRTVCDIIIAVKGNPKMNALGKSMKKRLETGDTVSSGGHVY